MHRNWVWYNSEYGFLALEYNVWSANFKFTLFGQGDGLLVLYLLVIVLKIENKRKNTEIIFHGDNT